MCPSLSQLCTWRRTGQRTQTKLSLLWKENLDAQPRQGIRIRSIEILSFLIANVSYHGTLQYGLAIYTAEIVLNCIDLTVNQGNENIYVINNILFKLFKNNKKCVLYGIYIFFPSKIFPISLTSVHQAATLLPWPFGLLISAASFTLLHTSEMWRPWLQTLLRRRCTMVAQSQNYAPCLAFKIFSGKVHDFLSFLGWHIRTSDQDFRELWMRISRSPFWLYLPVPGSTWLKLRLFFPRDSHTFAFMKIMSHLPICYLSFVGFFYSTLTQ